MRNLKIILIVCLLTLLTFLWLIFLGASYDDSNDVSKENLAIMLISIGLGIFLGIMAILYHALSFRYYNTFKSQRKIKKVPAFFIVCTILSHIYFLLISLVMISGSMIGFVDTNGEEFWLYLIALSVLTYAVLGIIETTIFKRRIQQYKEEVFLRNEIDTIGLLDTSSEY